MKKQLLFGLIVVLFLSGTAAATLIGDSVTIQRNYSRSYTPTRSVTVGTRIELWDFDDWLIDISDYSILMDSLSNTGYGFADFNGFIFSDLDFGSNDEIISSVNVTGIDPSRVFFSEHSISLNFRALGFANTSSINLDITTSMATPVPEPATLILFGIGLAGLAGNRIRRKK